MKVLPKLLLIFIVLTSITVVFARPTPAPQNYDAIVADVILAKISENETEVYITGILYYERYPETPWREVTSNETISVFWINKDLSLKEGDEIVASIVGCPKEYGYCNNDYGYNQEGWIMDSGKIIKKKDNSTINYNNSKSSKGEEFKGITSFLILGIFIILLIGVLVYLSNLKKRKDIL
jgi:hypothetical protein